MSEQPKQILVVDDDVSIQDAVRIILERRGYAVTIVSSGEVIFDRAFGLPDLIILDKQLPGVDGLDLCRVLKADPRTSGIPVLILSASPQTALQAPRAGADGFLEKPFRMQELRVKVQRLLEEHAG